MRGFTLELRWRQINVSKMTLDIWYLKIIVMKFRKSMSSDSTSVVICHLAENRPRFLHARSTALYAPKGKDGSLWEWYCSRISLLSSRRSHPNSNPRPLERAGFPGQYPLEFNSLQWWGSSSAISTGASTRNISLCKMWNTAKEFNFRSYLRPFILQLDKPQCGQWSWHRVVNFKIFILLPSGVVTFKPVTKQADAVLEGMGATWEVSLLTITQPALQHPETRYGLLRSTPSTHIHISEMAVGSKHPGIKSWLLISYCSILTSQITSEIGNSESASDQTDTHWEGQQRSRPNK